MIIGFVVWSIALFLLGVQQGIEWQERKQGRELVFYNALEKIED